MVQIKDYCDNCNQKININIYQTIINHHLRWSISYICPFCNATIEFDDIGHPPEDIRQTILASEGEYQLFIKQSEFNRIRTVKVLHDALNISITEAFRILKIFPNSVVVGTKTEMIYLQELLKAEGIEADVINL